MAARMKHIVRSWAAASDCFRRNARTPKHGGPMRVNLGYATWLHERQAGDNPPSYAVRFHFTDVVTFHPDGWITIKTDGWFTPTTRDRIDDYTPAEIWVRARNMARRSTHPVEYVVVVGRGEDQVEFDLVAEDLARIAPALLAH